VDRADGWLAVTAGWPTGQPPLRPPATTARALADLARAGYQLLDEPSMQVEYEVRHGVDRPRSLAATVEQLPDEAMFAEALASTAHGSGLIVGTRVGDSRPPGPAGGYRSWLEVVDVSDYRASFRGSERPNLTFRHESAQEFEGIVCVEDEPRKMLLRHGLAVLDALRHIAETGLHADAPLLGLQCPAQLPPNTFTDLGGLGGRSAGPARSSSIAIRFTMALDRPSADLRLQIADRLARYCAERGLGLWLRDTRAGYRSGNWFLVTPHDTTVARRSYPRAADHHGASNAAQGCVPVTFIGPARPGATHAILSFLAQFPELGALGCSMRPLNELAFLHLQLAVNGATRPRIAALNQALGLLRETEQDLDATLRALVPQLLREAESAQARREQVEHLIGRAGDYRTAFGPALHVTADHVTRRVPIWLSWRLPYDESRLRLPLICLQQAVDGLHLVDSDPEPAGQGSGGGRPEQVQHAPHVEYLNCRAVGKSFLWGKAKLSVSKNLVERRFAGPPSASGRLSAELLRAWTAELAAAGHVGRPDELSVSPHESWLTHGSALS
jgi:hypothetical protein